MHAKLIVNCEDNSNFTMYKVSMFDMLVVFLTVAVSELMISPWMWLFMAVAGLTGLIMTLKGLRHASWCLDRDRELEERIRRDDYRFRVFLLRALQEAGVVTSTKDESNGRSVMSFETGNKNEKWCLRISEPEYCDDHVVIADFKCGKEHLLTKLDMPRPLEDCHPVITYSF